MGRLPGMLQVVHRIETRHCLLLVGYLRGCQALLKPCQGDVKALSAMSKQVLYKKANHQASKQNEGSHASSVAGNIKDFSSRTKRSRRCGLEMICN